MTDVGTNAGHHIPQDVIDVLKSAFASANRAVAMRLCRLPNVWETVLDQALIDSLVDWGGPVVLDSGWTVRIETHFLGGGRHWAPMYDDFPPSRRWEIADIGVIAMMRRGSQLTRTKLALLQSKRLYPNEQAIDEAEWEHYAIGFGRLFAGNPFAEDASAARTFRFSPESTYRVILAGDAQVDRIAQYETQRKVPVHYLLYNPATMPWTQNHPLPAAVQLPDDNDIGCRVVDSASIREALALHAKGESPSYDDVRAVVSSNYPQPTAQAGWRLEDFIERLVTCKEGYRADSQYDDGLEYLFNRRSGPIAAAIGVTITAPEDESIFDE